MTESITPERIESWMLTVCAALPPNVHDWQTMSVGGDVDCPAMFTNMLELISVAPVAPEARDVRPGPCSDGAKAMSAAAASAASAARMLTTMTPFAATTRRIFSNLRIRLRSSSDFLARHHGIVSGDC